MAFITYQNALSKAAFLCSKSEKCVSDMRTKLYQWKLPADEHQRLIDYLLSEKYIDEERFTIYFVRDKFRFNKWGRVKIRYHLQHKEISESFIRAAFESEIDENDYRALVLSLAQSKLKSIKANSDFEKRGKLMQYLSGRGFEPDVVSQAITDLKI